MEFDQPWPDELEVTLFGRGQGECIVVHVGDGDWVVVDSFRHERRPIAQWYLDELGVERDRVKALVLTHLHADHYRGFADLYDRYPEARIVVTGALNQPHHLRLQREYQNDVHVLDGLPGVLKNAKRTRVQGDVPGYVEARYGQRVYLSPTVEVSAFSPTQAALQRCEDELEVALAGGERPVERHVREDNKSSVVLHVRVGDITALLGADLEASPADCGWQGVFNEPNNRLKPASLVKAPHHGGASGDDPIIWSELAEQSPVICVAPFSSRAMPTADDLARMCSVGSHVWQAARSTMREEWVDEDGVLRSGTGHVGLVRARRGPQDADWRVEAVPPGLRHGP